MNNIIKLEIKSVDKPVKITAVDGFYEFCCLLQNLTDRDYLADDDDSASSVLSFRKDEGYMYSVSVKKCEMTGDHVVYMYAFPSGNIIYKFTESNKDELMNEFDIFVVEDQEMYKYLSKCI